MKNQTLKSGSFKSVFSILSSKVFLLWMVGGWITYYVLSAIWMDEAFGSFAAGMKNNPFIQFPFILFLMSSCLNVLRVSRDVLKKGKMHFITWLILPAGILIFFTGFFLSLYARQSGQRITVEGDTVNPPWISKVYKVTGIEPGLRGSLLDTEKDKGFFAHEPKLTLMDDSSRSFEVGVFPPRKIGGAYYHILNFGIAPGIRLFEGGSIVYRDNVPLKLLALGGSDYFEIPPYPYKFGIALAPERTFRKGGVYVSKFNLERPVFRVRVFKGEKVIAEGDSRTWVRFDGFTIHFFRHRFWVLLEAAKDPGLTALRLGILLIAVGIPVHLVRSVIAGRWWKN